MFFSANIFPKQVFGLGSALVYFFLFSSSAYASTVYWSLFNIEGESSQSANYVTYSTLEDMLKDTNRTGVSSPNGFGPGFGKNVVGSGSDGTTNWSLFNIEGEKDISSNYVTYSTLTDMLNDTNRTGVSSPNGFGPGFGQNVVGSGSDGITYWSLFNIEEESSISANYVTYATLEDMLEDTNRTGVFSPNGFGSGFGQNIVGSGSDGLTYWSLFNIEGENDISSNYVTYATLSDMLNDTNRLGVFSPNGFGAGFGQNIVESGAYVIPVSVVPLPAAFPLFATILSCLGIFLFRKRKSTQI